MEKEKTNNTTTVNTCAFCELPLGEDYIVYKTIKVHPYCFSVADEKFEANDFAGDLKRVLKALKEKSMTTTESAEFVDCSEFASKPRARRVLEYMKDLGVIEQGEEERTYIRKVKVWKIKKNVKNK